MDTFPKEVPLNMLVNSRGKSYYLPKATQPKPIEWEKEKKINKNNAKNKNQNQ